ncbi:MAG TPA: hypothetical protein VFB33_13005 [Candidatus Binataceae bacterium]|nr:hypothetical protein [Candidatus Binataceae bacterium]
MASNVLAQTNTMSQPAESWFKDFHVSGFLNQTAGMWINPTNLKDYTQSRNNLATSRTWLQVDENYRLNANNQFFMREWFVYEPPYSFNSANNKFGAHMQALNDFYNQYNVRDAWWKLTAGPLTLYTGNQIVVWGQSLAFRVGDVINPQDTNWNFGFANLEQSRMPQWMIHPILNLPDWGAFNSNFIEGVFIPGVEPLWNSVDHPDGRYSGEYDIAGRVNNGFPAANHAPSARFDVHYPDFAYPGRTVTLGGDYPVEPGATNLIASPFSRVFYMCNNAPAGFPVPSLTGLLALTGQKNPAPMSLRRNCNFANGLVNVGAWHVPAVQWKNMEEGVRFHTLIGSNEITALYFNTFQYYPVISWVPYTGNFPAVFEPVQYMGATIDRPVPMPPSLAEYFPLVARAEAVYQNHAPFVNFNMTQPNAIRFSDLMTYMLAVDLDQAYAPWLTTTGNLSANFEFLDMIAMDGVNNLLDGPNGGDLNNNALKNDISMLFNVGTSYWWNAFAPTWTMIYEPKGTTFALFPSIQLNPPWTNKYFAKLGVIYVLGGDRNYVSPALFKGENMITVSGQYNFSAM